MGSKHYLEYAKTDRGRYGVLTPSKRPGEEPYPSWRHWGCVTPEILKELSQVGVTKINGWSKIATNDKDRVKKAIKARKLPPHDVSPALKKIDWSQINSTPLTQTASTSQSEHYLNSTAPAPTPSTIPQTQYPSNSNGLKRSASAMQSNGDAPLPTSPDDEDIFADDGLDEAAVADELFISLPTSVVGIQYYNVLVGIGEIVTLRREPTNQFDSNAIEVLNVGGVRVGHLPRATVTKLAPLLDRNMITVEGTMTEGNITPPKHPGAKKFNLGINIKIFGAAFMRPQLEQELIWATPYQRGFTDAVRQAMNPLYSLAGPTPPPPIPQPPASQTRYDSTAAERAAAERAATAKKAQQAQIEARAKALELRNMLSSLEKVDDEGRRSNLLDTVISTDDILTIPTFKTPPSVASGELNNDLLKHQLQGLQWCYDREHPRLPKSESEKPVQFWMLKTNGVKKYYYNLATKSPQQEPPSLGRGALMADDMGLGKTLTMLSLIITTMKEPLSDYSRATLIVAPLSVVSNWEQQIRDHVQQGVLKVFTYYGDARKKVTTEQLQNYDVVITTYQMVTADYPGGEDKFMNDAALTSQRKRARRDDGLFGIKWKRVILDEGHNIRNPKTKAAKAICALEADRRWCVSGTPIINSALDLGSIMKFLRICSPLDQPEYFKSLILRPVSQGLVEGAELMKALMSHICLRRTKEMEDAQGNRLVPLPPVDMTVVRVTLHDRAREIYDTVEGMSQKRVERFVRRSGGVTAPANVISMITRLRQITLHPGLVPKSYLDELKNADDDDDNTAPTIQLTAEDKIRLQRVLALAIEQMEECPICFDILKNPRITPCSHTFCLPCIEEVITRDPKCPMDRRAISRADLIEPPPPMESTQAPVLDHDPVDEDDEETEPSAKIDQLLKLLRLLPRKDKSLVFSFFTSFLDMVAARLTAEGIPFVRFDGTMSVKRRDAAVAKFMVPLSGNEVQMPPPVQRTLPAVVSTVRSRKSAKRPVVISDDEDEPSLAPPPAIDIPTSDADFVDPGNAEDDDFVAADTSDSDEDFLDYSKSSSKTKAKGNKGKGKGKNSSIVEDDESSSDEDFLDLSKLLEKKRAAKGNTKRKGKAKASATKKKASFIDTPTAWNTYDDDMDDQNPVVMLCSLKAAALGLNLTVANHVFLLDPWWQEGIESQAIDRCNRIGQKKKVNVYQFIAENTIESKVVEIQERKKAMIKHAFSGTRAVETQRQKREARLQELMELFRPRQRNPESAAGSSPPR